MLSLFVFFHFVYLKCNDVDLLGFKWQRAINELLHCGYDLGTVLLRQFLWSARKWRASFRHAVSYFTYNTSLHSSSIIHVCLNVCKMLWNVASWGILIKSLNIRGHQTMSTNAHSPTDKELGADFASQNSIYSSHRFFRETLVKVVN